MPNAHTRLAARYQMSPHLGFSELKSLTLSTVKMIKPGLFLLNQPRVFNSQQLDAVPRK